MVTLVFISLLWGEYYAIPAELLSIVIVFSIGSILVYATSSADETSAAQAFASAALVWLIVGVLSALPFALIAWTVAIGPSVLNPPSMSPTLRAFLSPSNAVFEGISGITGTGLTVTRQPSQLPATLQWWRSLIEWLGGIGIIVLILSVVRESEGNVLDQYYQERSPLGKAGDDIPPPKAMLGAFTAFTLLSMALLWIVGMPVWHAINHGITGLSTGGFAVTDQSIAAYDGLAVQVTLIPIMLLGAIPLPVYYLLLNGKLQGFTTDLQTRWLLLVTAAGAAIISVLLLLSDTYRSTLEAGTRAAFQFTSAITCTGFSAATDMATIWPSTAMLLLTLAMIVGGSEGSTASGVKIVRVVSLVQGIRERVREPFPGNDPSREIEISGEHVSSNFYNASIILSLWVAFLLAGVFALLITLPSESASLQAVLFEVASAQGNVGLSSGVTSADQSPIVKVVLMVNMWVGRLTIIPVLVLVRGVV